MGATAFGQNPEFNGLVDGLGSLSRLSNAQSRSISAENITGEKGKGAMAVPVKLDRKEDYDKTDKGHSASWAAQELGQGFKVCPSVYVLPKETVTIAEMEGPGAITHIWMTPTGNWRSTILRIYWDDEKEPSVECPIGDFFCNGWNEYANVSSIPVCVNPKKAFNCYWQMPFRKKCKMTIENIDPKDHMLFFYQVDYTLTDIPEDAAYFHAQWRRTLFNQEPEYTIIDGIKGRGHFVGVYLAWGVHNNGWWGEGETKFYIDSDKKFPTIVTTGLEDYIGGSYNFDINGKYTEFSSPYTGFQVVKTDETYRSQRRFGMYRWHITDPVRFQKDLRITIHDMGYDMKNTKYHIQHSDISATSFWYQTEPHASFPEFPGWDLLEIK